MLIDALVASLLLQSEPGTWPQWRGPTRDGQVHDAPWPDHLTLEPVWRVEDLGPSYSGPIVGESLVYTTETRDKETEIVRAVDRTTGEVAWETSWEGAMKVPFFAAKNGSWIRSTPALADGRLFVAGMRDVLACLDATSGEVLWTVDFVDRYDTPLPAFGFVCSPLVEDGAVYVQAGASFCKIDAATGETIWRSLVDDGGMNGSAFSSPTMAEIPDSRQLVVLSRTHLHGVAPDTGDELWEMPIKAFRGMNILTPVVHEGDVFTATYGGTAQRIDLVSDEGGVRAESLWKNPAQGYMTSPIVIDEHAYYFARSQRFLCLSMADGSRTWTSPPTKDDYWSLVANGDRILALNDQGILRLLRASPEGYEELADRKVAEDQTWAHLSVVGRHLFIREQGALACWAWISD